MDDGGAALQNLLFFGLLIAGMFFLIIRPQRARAKAMARVKAELAPGRRVITTAGIHATVTEVDTDTVTLEVAPGVNVRFVHAAVVRLLDEPVEAAGESAEGPAGP